MLEVRAVHGSFIGCKQNQIALRGCHLDDLICSMTNHEELRPQGSGLSTVHPLYEEFATMKVLPCQLERINSSSNSVIMLITHDKSNPAH